MREEIHNIESLPLPGENVIVRYTCEEGKFKVKFPLHF